MRYKAYGQVAMITGKICLLVILMMLVSAQKDAERIENRHIYNVPADLQTKDFQTPIDRELTEKINTFAEQEWLKKIITLYYDEWKDKLTINLNNVTKVKVTAHQYAWLHEMVFQASSALGITPPITYIIGHATPNAYVTNVKSPILVLHSAIIKLLNREELFFVIGHELGHIKSGHVLTHDIVSTALYALDKVPLVNKLAPLSWLLWAKEAEISADRVGLLLLQDTKICSSALIKLLSGLTEQEGGQINIEAFLQQKAEVEADAVVLRRIPVLLAEATSTHPFIGTRVRALAEFKNSPQFSTLMRGPNMIQIQLTLR